MSGNHHFGLIELSQGAPARINVLPNELLSEIFLCVHDTIFERMEEPLTGPPPCAFLSHVCHRWRNVAASCQRLWSLLPRQSREWTRTCLARAHSCPVDLRFDIFQPMRHLQNTRRLALPAIPRAESLTLYMELDRYEASRRDMTEILRGLAEHTAPLLEELTITLDQDFTGDEYRPTAIPALFNDETPQRLRSIFLDGCLLRTPQTLASPSLTDLYLGNSCIWTDVDDMIRFFQHVPNLESFSFTHSSSDEHGFDTKPSNRHPHRCVSLPKLNHFDVEGSFVAGLRIFSYLAFPSEATLYLKPSDCLYATRERYTDDEISNLVACASAAVRAHFAKDIQEGKCFKAVDIGHTSISALGCHFGVPGGLRGAPQLRSAAAATYLAVPVFADTKTLTIGGEMRCFTMRDLMGFKKVERLYLEGVTSVLFELALLQQDPQTNELFPECTRIIIRDFNFIAWPGTSRYAHVVPKDFVERLADILLIRRQYAKEFVTIVFDKCTMDPCTEALFREKFGEGCIRIP